MGGLSIGVTAGIGLSLLVVAIAGAVASDHLLASITAFGGICALRYAIWSLHQARSP